MSHRIYEVKLTTATSSIVRYPLAENTLKALRIAMEKMPDDIDGPCRISCKPCFDFENIAEKKAA